jgi:hypothetical protein
MRKLRRSDKPKSDILVRDGGKSVQQFLYQEGVYEMTFGLSYDEVFHSAEPSSLLDGVLPFLNLKCRSQ